MPLKAKSPTKAKKAAPTTRTHYGRGAKTAAAKKAAEPAPKYNIKPDKVVKNKAAPKKTAPKKTAVPKKAAPKNPTAPKKVAPKKTPAPKKATKPKTTKTTSKKVTKKPAVANTGKARKTTVSKENLRARVDVILDRDIRLPSGWGSGNPLTPRGGPIGSARVLVTSPKSKKTPPAMVNGVEVDGFARGVPVWRSPSRVGVVAALPGSAASRARYVVPGRDDTIWLESGPTLWLASGGGLM